MPPLFRQPITISSVNLTEEQFLHAGSGTPVVVAGELRVPIGPARVPAVVLVHGDGGDGPNERQWADLPNSIGLGVLVLDSVNGRGIAETSTDPGRQPNVARPSCLTEERAGGIVAHRATGGPPARDACVQFGASIGHDPRAFEEARRRVTETLVAALGGG